MRTLILSPLQKSCLWWVSQGRTTAEIASLEGGDIESYLQNALEALNEKSITEALKKMKLSV